MVFPPVIKNNTLPLLHLWATKGTGFGPQPIVCQFLIHVKQNNASNRLNAETSMRI